MVSIIFRRAHVSNGKCDHGLMMLDVSFAALKFMTETGMVFGVVPSTLDLYQCIQCQPSNLHDLQATPGRLNDLLQKKKMSLAQS